MGKPHKVTLPLRVTPEVAERVKAIADDLCVSPAWVVRRAIDRYLADLDAGQDLAEALSIPTITADILIVRDDR